MRRCVHRLRVSPRIDRDAHPQESYMERIMVALDGSDHSDKALDLASDIAAKSGAELVLLPVISDKPLTDAERHMAERSI